MRVERRWSGKAGLRPEPQDMPKPNLRAEWRSEGVYVWKF
jgi:hypothetical protein